MSKLPKHSWQKTDGFRTHICIHCGLIRYWDNEFRKLMYKTKWKIWYFEMPKCKSTYTCDKIEQPEKETINFLKHKNFIA
jgi:hypothetical protein